MWVFTEVADWFDKQRLANAKFLDQTFTGWVDYTLKHGDDEGFFPAVRNAMIYNVVGGAFAVNALSTTVASGFVDTLRIGDGVRKGGWGYAQDALRFLVIAGPLLRAGRVGLAWLVDVDVADGQPICSWVASTQALKLTGVRHFATVDQLAQVTGEHATTVEEASNLTGLGHGGVAAAASAGPARFLGDLLAELIVLGADARTAGGALNTSAPVETELLKLLESNPNSVAPFSVFWRWTGMAGREANQFAQGSGGLRIGDTVGHSMVAFRSVTGGLRILDRSGKIARSLAELDELLPDGRYGGIGAASFYPIEDTALLIRNSTVVTVLESGATVASYAQVVSGLMRGADGILSIDSSWIRKAIGLEVRSVPFRVEVGQPVRPPVRVAPAAAGGPIPTQTVCVPTSLEGGVRLCAGSTYVLKEGDTLWMIAIRAYGDPQRWRDIARTNGIQDPDHVPVGTVLTLPP